MSKDRSTKSTQGKSARYPSRYTDKYVTCAQYISEIMCERKAADEKVDLPRFFWNTSKKWKGYYFYQIKLANKLLKTYSCDALIKAVREHKVFSLNNKKLVQFAEKFAKEVKPEVEVDLKVVEQPSAGKFHRPNKLGKLDE